MKTYRDAFLDPQQSILTDDLFENELSLAELSQTHQQPNQRSPSVHRDLVLSVVIDEDRGRGGEDELSKRLAFEKLLLVRSASEKSNYLYLARNFREKREIL